MILVLNAALILVLAMTIGVNAQAGFDPQNTVYATGAILESEEQLADIQRTRTFRAYLPASVDLSGRFPRVGNQGKQGSCTAWAVGYAARSYYNAAPKQGSRLRQSQIPSPAYIYNTIRGPDSTCQGGSKISKALQLLKKGTVSMAEYPYNHKRCRRPGSSIISQAVKFRIRDWLVVDTRRFDQVKAELAKGHPVIIGMRPNSKFLKLRGPRIWRSGKPRKKDPYHAITLVGYNERGQYFKFVNSWGKGWGDAGFGRMSYNTFRKRVYYGFSMRPKDGLVRPKPIPIPEPVIVGITIPKPSCGKITVKQQNGAIHVSGFVGTRDELRAVENALKDINATNEVELRPWPQCEALVTMQKPLSEIDKPVIELPKNKYSDGETLSFNIKMAAFQGYLHVAYIQKDGNVVNLVRSDPLTLETLSKNTILKFGDGEEGRAKFTIGKPFGDEMIIVISSKSPLFVEKRPRVETEREFLSAMRKAIIARPNPNSPERHISADFVTLQTTR